MGPGQIGLCDYQTAKGTHGITGLTDLSVTDNLIILDRDNTTALSTVRISDGAWERIEVLRNRIVFFDHARGQYAHDIQPKTAVAAIDENVYFGTDADAFSARQHERKVDWPAWRHSGYDTGSSFAPLDGTSPSVVDGLRAQRTDGETALRWDPATDSQSGVHHYNVYRGTRAGFRVRYLTLVGQPTEPEFRDPDPVPEGGYWYKVEAEDGCGNRSGQPAVVRLEAQH